MGGHLSCSIEVKKFISAIPEWNSGSPDRGNSWGDGAFVIAYSNVSSYKISNVRLYSSKVKDSSSKLSVDYMPCRLLNRPFNKIKLGLFY